MATPRVQKYLEAELSFSLAYVRPNAQVLELDCGYGRVLQRLLPIAKTVIGIDTSLASLAMAVESVGSSLQLSVAAMDAAQLGFSSGTFDLTLCVQNGISAFKRDPRRLIAEAVRVTRPGGTVLLSTYAAKFWNHRLEWFRIQAEHGLIGEIDEDASKDGVIVCKDGFRATTIDEARFRDITESLGLASGTRLFEVDESSLFCNRRSLKFLQSSLLRRLAARNADVAINLRRRMRKYWAIFRTYRKPLYSFSLTVMWLYLKKRCVTLRDTQG